MIEKNAYGYLYIKKIYEKLGVKSQVINRFL